MKKILTIEQLVNFCKENKMYSFNSKDDGYKLAVQIPSNLIYSQEEDEDPKTIYAKIKVCHTLLNRNGSFISEENMKKAMPTLQEYTPLLGYIHQLDNGEYDFHAHDMDIKTDINGNEYVDYKEHQIGTFTTDEPYLEYDKDNDKTYVVARVAIPTTYTKAAEIIKRKGGTKVSCELEISSYSYNAKENYLELEDFAFIGCTCLGSTKDGKEIGEGMLGSRLDLEDFSVKNSSMFNCIESKLVESLDSLNKTLQEFNINNFAGKEEIEVEKEEIFEEETEAVEEQVEEQVEETTEEVTEEATEEEATVETEEMSEEETVDDPEVQDEVIATEENACGKKKKKCSIEIHDKTFSFELSLDEKIYALEDLVNAMYSEQDNTYYGIKAYEKDLIMIDYWYGKAYRQSYAQEGSEFSLVGDRVEVFANWLTKEEENALSEMRSNYSTLSDRVKSYEDAEFRAQKEEILKDESYEQFLENDLFKELVENMDNYSVEELKDKAELAFAKCVKESANFSFNKKQSTVKTFAKPDVKAKKKSPYGNLFD